MSAYEVVATRSDSHGSVARCKCTEITLDTDVNGRADACNPAELVLAAIAGCGIAATPGIVIEGKVVHAGGLPKSEDLARWLAV